MNLCLINLYLVLLLVFAVVSCSLFLKYRHSFKPVPYSAVQFYPPIGYLFTLELY